VAKYLDKRLFDVEVISPRNHMLFTPLLASTAVGTLEFRSIAEPLKASVPEAAFTRARAVAVDPSKKMVEIESVDPLNSSGPVAVAQRGPFPSSSSSSLSPPRRTVSYDLLVIGVGARVNTFNIPGADKYTRFLKELADARAIRRSVIANVEACTYPGVSDQERARLLSVVIVGGGPTGVEFAAELHDLVEGDLARQYPHAARDLSITIVEGRSILGGFDASLREYVERRFARSSIRIRTGASVVQVEPDAVKLSDRTVLPFGLCVWNTGIAPNVKWGAAFATDKWGHVVVDERLRALVPEVATTATTTTTTTTGNAPQQSAAVSTPLSTPSQSTIPCVFALGDAASVRGKEYAATAQVAEQQGRWLAKSLNAAAKAAPAAADTPERKAQHVAAWTFPSSFEYKHRGSLAFIGRMSAAADFSKAVAPLRGLRVRGFVAWIIWRSAYLTKLGSWRNRLQVPADWLRTLIFGRDTSVF
jgi:NADH:ubiquinone reductase (non-electrogenic)